MSKGDDIWGLLLLLISGFLAGGINAIAGGGTILTFAVLSAILPAGPGRLVAANVTSKIGLWPGAAAAAWAYRGSREAQPPWARWLILPSAVGAVIGVVLLRILPKESFDAVVPWLILLAAVLFAVQPQLTRLVLGMARPRMAAAASVPSRRQGPPPRCRPAGSPWSSRSNCSWESTAAISAPASAS
jgi:uncharacterized membrane protein YfcA